MKSPVWSEASISRREPYLGTWPGSCNGPRDAASSRSGRQDWRRNWAPSPVFACSMPIAEAKSTSGRVWALAAAACLLATLVADVVPRPADSAPLRVVTLGRTAETPPAAGPGKILNGEAITAIESIACRKSSRGDTLLAAYATVFFNHFSGKLAVPGIAVLRPVER